MIRLLLIFILMLMLGPAYAESDPNRLRVSIDTGTNEPVWVGQQVLISITLFMVDRQRGSPTFRLPQVPGGVLIQIPGSPVFDSEEYDGISFASWTYSLAFYPHRVGEHNIGVIEVLVDQPEGNGTWKRLQVETQPFVIVSRLPAAAADKASLITSTQLEVTEQWDPEQTDLKVGDAITRKITIKAADVLAMGLPPIKFQSPEGLAVYPQTPQVNEQAYRGKVTGERVDEVIYICERAGSFTLPAVRINGFNPETEMLEETVLPEKILQVMANPALVTQGSESKSKLLDSSAKTALWKFALMAVIAAFGLFALIRLKRRLSRYLIRPRGLNPLNPSSRDEGN